MRMQFRYSKLLSEVAQALLYTADSKAVVIASKSYEQSWVLVVTMFKILLKMNLCPRIEVDRPFFTALAEHDAFPVLKVNVRAILQGNFANSHSRRCK